MSLLNRLKAVLGRRQEINHGERFLELRPVPPVRDSAEVWGGEVLHDTGNWREVGRNGDSIFEGDMDAARTGLSSWPRGLRDEDETVGDVLAVSPRLNG